MHLHSRDYAGSEYVSYARVDRRGAEFIANKHTDKFTHVQFVMRHLLLSSICLPNMKYIFNRSQVPYKGPKISKWVTFFSSSVSIQRWIMGGHPLLLEWHGSATISIIDWEF